MESRKLIVERHVEEILGWPTDTFSIDWPQSRAQLHTILVFVPGNPGLVEWYIPFFSDILKAIGPGYAVRGASHAGHSIDAQQIHVEEDATANDSTRVPPKTLAWTIDGQVHHKIAYIEKMLDEMRATTKLPCLIFVGHSIGCHLLKRILLHRADFLRQTVRCLFLMPFIRMDAPAPHQQLLDLVSQYPTASKWILQNAARFLATLSSPTLESLLESTMDKQEHREFTAKLLRQTHFPSNFLGLGLEEIRDVPQAIDVRDAV